MRRTQRRIMMGGLAVAVGMTGCYAGAPASEQGGSAGTDDGVADGSSSEPGDDGTDDAGSTGPGGNDSDGWSPPELDDEPPTSPVVRLTRSEYVRTIDAALGVEPPPLSSLPNDSNDGIFAGIGAETFGDFSGYVDVAQQVAEGLAPNLVDTCDWVVNTAGCLESELDTNLGGLIRRPLSTEDRDELVALFGRVHDQTEAVEPAIAAVLMRALLDDRFLFHIERGEEPGSTPEAMLLSDHELAERMSYYLLDAPPAAALSTAAEAGELTDDPDARAQWVATLLDDQRADDKAWDFAAAWLKLPATPPEGAAEPEEPDPEEPDPEEPDPPDEPVDECNSTAQCIEQHGMQATDCANSGANDSVCMCGAVPCMQEAPHQGVHGFVSPRRPMAEVSPELAASMYEETRRFVDYVLLSGEVPMQDLFTADYSFIDATLAEHYGVPAPETDWALYEFPPEARRKGVLTHASFLTNNGAHHRDESWIFRGNAVLGRLFCFEFPPPPDGALEAEVESRESDPQCAGCHSIMDPVGRMFDRYDETGALLTDGISEGRLVAGSDIDGEFDDVIDFLDAIGESEAFTHCMSQMMIRHSLGREAAIADQASFDAIWEALDVGNFQDARSTLMTSEAFATVYIPPAEQVCE